MRNKSEVLRFGPSMDVWNPAKYERFKRERQLPFFDLLDLVRPQPDMQVLDLGCGTGELTHIAAEQLQVANILGIDTSAAMLERAVAYESERVRFKRQDICEFEPDTPVDLVLSNASLHWIEGHEDLLRRFATWQPAGGQLAIQVPANHDHPSHQVAAEVAGEEPFASLLCGYTGHHNILAPESYAQILHRLGFKHHSVRLYVYSHILASVCDVLEWLRGTTLTAFAARLPRDIYQHFESVYRQRLLAHLGDHRPFLYTFKRILMWGQTPLS